MTLSIWPHPVWSKISYNSGIHIALLPSYNLQKTMHFENAKFIFVLKYSLSFSSAPLVKLNNSSLKSASCQTLFFPHHWFVCLVTINKKNWFFQVQCHNSAPQASNGPANDHFGGCADLGGGHGHCLASITVFYHGIVWWRQNHVYSYLAWWTNEWKYCWVRVSTTALYFVCVFILNVITFTLRNELPT